MLERAVKMTTDEELCCENESRWYVADVFQSVMNCEMVQMIDSHLASLLSVSSIIQVDW